MWNSSPKIDIKILTIIYLIFVSQEITLKSEISAAKTNPSENFRTEVSF